MYVRPSVQYLEYCKCSVMLDNIIFLKLMALLDLISVQANVIVKNDA